MTKKLLKCKNFLHFTPIYHCELNVFGLSDKKKMHHQLVLGFI